MSEEKKEKNAREKRTALIKTKKGTSHSSSHSATNKDTDSPKIKLKLKSPVHGKKETDVGAVDSTLATNADVNSKRSSDNVSKKIDHKTSSPHHQQRKGRDDTKTGQSKANKKTGDRSSHYEDKNRDTSFDNKKNNEKAGKHGRSGETSQETSKRTFKTTRKKQFVSKRKEFVEKEITIKSKKKKEPVPLANPIPKSISIMESISIVDLAKKMNVKASELLSKLMSMGMMANQNTVIDYETVQVLASEYDCEIEVVSLYEQTLIETPKENQDNLKMRPPVVTIMGHVDHGKTTLLDTIRKSNVAEQEQGEITQHIGAYMVELGKDKITFLDTPGHEAFTLMRSRGAKITDIIVLVVAADDGLMPQSIEAISHAKEAKVPVIVALNKMDIATGNPDKVLEQLSEHEIIPEDWGGDVPVCRVSALKNEGISNLLEHIVLQAEVMDIKVDENIPAQGVVLESKIEQGRGIVASILIQKGTLKKGDSFVVGVHPGKVREIYNDRGENVDKAKPSMPVEIIGIDGMPSAGDPFQVTENEKISKQISNKRQELIRHNAGQSVKKVTVDTLYESIESENVDTLKVIVKGDVHGSVEAIKEALEKLSQEEIKVNVIHASAGTINAADVLLASASNAILIGFHVRPNAQVQKLANQEKVDIQRYTVIFDVIDSIKKQVEGMLSPEYKEEKIGEAEVREIFSVPKFGVIAGCYMHSGKVDKNSIIKVIRKGKEIHAGKVASLKRFKDDVNKVETGFECGIAVEGTDDIQPEDILMVYHEVAVARVI